MKINWGTSIVIAYSLFLAFILYFVITVQENPKYENELVVEEYYKHDAHYGEEMLKLENAQGLKEKPMITESAEGVHITFPESINPAKISGELSAYRPSNKKLDFKTGLKLSGNSQLLAKDNFVDGLWDLTLSWQYDGKEYIIKKEIYLK